MARQHFLGLILVDVHFSPLLRNAARLPRAAYFGFDRLIDRFRFGRGLGEQRIDLGELLLGEVAILDRLGVDEDIQRAAAQSGIGGEHRDAGVADDVEIALVGGVFDRLMTS